MPKTVTLRVQQSHLERNKSLTKIPGTPLKCALYIYFKRKKPKTTGPAQISTFSSPLWSIQQSHSDVLPLVPTGMGTRDGHGQHIQRRTELPTHFHCPRNVWGSDIPAVGAEATMKARVMSEVSWQKATRGGIKQGFSVSPRDGGVIFPCGEEFSSALETLCKLIPRCSGHLSCLDITVATNSCVTRAAWARGTCEQMLTRS